MIVFLCYMDLFNLMLSLD